MTELEQAARQLLIDISVGNPTDVSLTTLREALAQPQVGSSKTETTTPQGEWVDLTDDELKAALEVHQVGLSVRIGRIAIAAFKEKNK